VKANQAVFSIAMMCRVLGVSRSGYYAWRDRPPSRRALADARLGDRIKAIHSDSRRTYGAPRVHAALAAEDERVGCKRVARLMRRHGLEGVHRRKFVRTTQRDEAQRPAPDRVERNFSASTPNELWVADITYVPTWEGTLYLAVVQDVFSRRVVGWSMANHMRTELVLSALQMAVDQRRPTNVIHHSDQGSQYTSVAFGTRCEKVGVEISMGSVGDCFDNAMAESFFATLECELIDRSIFRTREEARLEVFDFIEGFYNTNRIHSSIGYVSPIAFERRARLAGEENSVSQNRGVSAGPVQQSWPGAQTASRL